MISIKIKKENGMSDLTITWPGRNKNQSSVAEGAAVKIPDPAVVLPNEAKGLQAFGDEDANAYCACRV